MEPILFLPLVISFFVTFIVLPKWIAKAKKIGLVWEEMHKYNHPKNVAGSGGLIVVMGFILGVLVYISLKTFYFKSDVNVMDILALISSVLILAGIGLIDDLLGWWHGGLSKKFRLFMCIFAAVPLMVINAGNSQAALPFLDGVTLGWLYPLIIIPIGIVGASTTFNFLAGWNGLESGQGMIILTALSFVAYMNGNTWITLIGMCMVLSLLAFWIFNKVPAKVFPGDILTYSVGGLIAMMAILGDMEKIAVFFFIPYILEVVLKSRGRLKKQSFGKPNKDNSLEMPYDKVYGLEHFAIFCLKKVKNKVYQNDVVYFIYGIQILTVFVGLVIFRNAIF